MKYDLHVHTLYSKHWFWGRDALNTPREMIKAAIKRGLNGIAITDHNSVKGGLSGRKELNTIDKNFKIIVGSEIRTASGDMLALDIKEDIPALLSVDETIERIHKQGGIAIAAHPFAEFWFRKCLGKEAMKADAIEIFNSNGTISVHNKRALKLAEEFEMPKSAGSDSHSWRTIGNAGIICNENVIDEILNDKNKVFGKRNPNIEFCYLSINKFGKAIKNIILRRKTSDILKFYE